MGLDITAYSNLIPGQPGEGFDADGDVLWDDGWVRLYENPDFPGRADGLDCSLAYREDEAESMGFRAGGYSGYGNWRNQLAKLAGYPEVRVDRYNTGNVELRHDHSAWNAESGPFWELINFSDCEGTLGPVVARKLAQDFADFQEQADRHPDDYFRERYADWRQAFEMARNNGAVCFH